MKMTTTYSEKLKTAALEYIDAEYSVIPLHGKAPLIPWTEFRKRVATTEEVSSWFDTYGTQITGLGMITGYVEDLGVLDLEKGEDPSRFEIPETVTSRSGGDGRHFYFRLPENIEVEKASCMNLRVHNITGDFKCEGGYIVVPPSVHPTTGKEYEWIVPLDRDKLAVLPEWILNLETKNSEKKDWSGIVSGVKEGDRHNSTVSLTGKLLYHLPPNEWETIALPMLMAWNEQLNDPPLEEKEIMSVFDSIAKKELLSRKGKESLSIESSNEIKLSRTLLTISAILNMPESEKPLFIVDRLVPDNGITAISGHPGCGKSWLMLHMAYSVATGTKFLGTLETVKGNVLIVDEENGVYEMRRRMKCLEFPEDLPIFVYSQNGFKIDKESDLNSLLETVQENKIRLVIFDPFVAIHSKIENNAEEAQKVMEALQKFNAIGATVVYLHHHRKSGFGGAGQSLRGSSALSGRLDSHISVEKSNQTQTTTSLDIEHAKSRRGQNMPQFRAILNQEETDGKITLVYEGIDEKTIKKDRARNYILEFLRSGEQFTDVIVETIQNELAIGSRNVMQALKDLETDKLVSSSRDGKKKKYALVDEQILNSANIDESC